MDEADRIMEDIQNDWLSHVESCVYSEGRERFGPLTVAEISKRKLPLQKLLFSATLSQNPEKLEKMNLFEPKLFTSVVQPKDILKISDSVTTSVTDDDVESRNVGEFIGKYTTPNELSETLVKCSDIQLKPLVLQHLLVKKNVKRALVFTQSTSNSHTLTVMLQQFGLCVGELSSQVRKRRHYCGRILLWCCYTLIEDRSDIFKKVFSYFRFRAKGQKSSANLQMEK